MQAHEDVPVVGEARKETLRHRLGYHEGVQIGTISMTTKRLRILKKVARVKPLISTKPFRITPFKVEKVPAIDLGALQKEYETCKKVLASSAMKLVNAQDAFAISKKEFERANEALKNGARAIVEP